MKKIMLVCAAMFTLAAMTACKSGTTTTDTIAADTVSECTPLFDGLQYNDEGIAFIKDLPIEVNDGGRYDFRDNAPVYAGKWGCTAVGFDYCGKNYYIPVDENIDWPHIFPCAVSVTIKVWRDYTDYYYDDKEENKYIGPFALITDFSM